MEVQFSLWTLSTSALYNLSAYKHNAINVKKFLIILYLQEIFLSH